MKRKQQTSNLSPKKIWDSFYRKRVYKRPSVGWLDVFSMVMLPVTVQCHRAILIVNGRKYSGPGLPPHTPLSGYAGRVSPPGHRPVSFFSQVFRHTNSGYSTPILGDALQAAWYDKHWRIVDQNARGESITQHAASRI
jgi:hypothetical protein